MTCVVFTCVSLTIGDAEYFYTPVARLYDISEKCLFRFWPIFDQEIYFLVLFELLMNPCQMYGFSHSIGGLVPCPCLDCFLCCAQGFQLDGIPLVCCCFCCLLWVSYLKSLPDDAKKGPPAFSPCSFGVSHLTFKYSIPLEFIFVWGVKSNVIRLHGTICFPGIIY